MKLGPDTTVPLGWVATVVVALIMSAVSGTYWVYTVNGRLYRIERKLGIDPLESVKLPSFEPNAHAKSEDPR